MRRSRTKIGPARSPPVEIAAERRKSNRRGWSVANPPVASRKQEKPLSGVAVTSAGRW
jgi:hypothetical protein